MGYRRSSTLRCAPKSTIACHNGTPRLVVIFMSVCGHLVHERHGGRSESAHVHTVPYHCAAASDQWKRLCRKTFNDSCRAGATGAQCSSVDVITTSANPRVI